MSLTPRGRRRAFKRALPPLLARLAMGARFAAAGAGKLAFLLWRADELASRGATLGLSPATLRVGVPLVSAVEIAAGAALVLGFRARSAAAALLGVLWLYVGIEAAHAGALPGRAEAFDAAVYSIVLLWLAVSPAGPWSLDGWLSGRRAAVVAKRSGPAPTGRVRRLPGAA